MTEATRTQKTNGQGAVHGYETDRDEPLTGLAPCRAPPHARAATQATVAAVAEQAAEVVENASETVGSAA